MLQIILVLAVACVAAYFIASSRKSKVGEVSKDGQAPLNPTFDPVQATSTPIVEVQEGKKVVKKKAAPKKKTSK